MFVSFGTKFVKNGPGKTGEQRQKKWVSTHLQPYNQFSSCMSKFIVVWKFVK